VSERYEHVACFVDESEAAREALDHAQRLHDQLGAARLSIVHLIPPPVYFGVYYPPRDTAPPTIPQWLRDLEGEVPGAEVVFIDSFSAYPPAEAVRWAGSESVDLAVAASHRGVFQRMVVGSFAGYLAYHAPCPVVLIPPSMREQETTRGGLMEGRRMREAP
jgi:nucleotide-binding universal stress UspA family protein